MRALHGLDEPDSTPAADVLALASVGRSAGADGCHRFHGGLQFQIEHHLFPRVPRHNLRRVRALVLEHCAKHDIHYHSVSFLKGNCEVIAAMRETAMAARNMPRDKDVIDKLKKSWIVEMMNAAG